MSLSAAYWPDAGPEPTPAADLRALTIRQPWSAAVVHGEKNIENRTYRTHRRGLILIHAGQRYEHNASRPVLNTWLMSGRARSTRVFGSIVGVAELVDCHSSASCCEPWGEDGDKIWHWVLADRRPLPEPVPALGALGFWRPSAEVAERVLAQIGASA